MEALSYATDYLLRGWTWLSDNAAGVVAALAFFATAYQAWLMRQHNRTSLRPHLSTTIQTYQEHSTIKVVALLHNAGLGPAFIDTFEIVVADKAHAVTEPEQVGRIVESHLQVPITDARFHVLREGAVFRAGDDIELGRLSFQIKAGDSSPELLKERLDQLHVRIKHTSAYGEKATYDSRQHRQQDTSAPGTCFPLIAPAVTPSPHKVE